MKKYDKLVRDKIPEIIAKNNKKCEIENEENQDSLLKYYYEKLKEELNEVICSKNNEEMIEELADLSEVIDGLIIKFNAKEDFDRIKSTKKETNGGFSNLILKSVTKDTVN